jgi:hypothetical protein
MLVTLTLKMVNDNSDKRELIIPRTPKEDNCIKEPKGR